MQFLHEAAGSPVTSTWTTEVRNGYFISWPGLTVENINKHLPKSVATTRGHIEMQHKGATYAITNLPIQEEEDPIGLLQIIQAVAFKVQTYENLYLRMWKVKRSAVNLFQNKDPLETYFKRFKPIFRY